MEKLSFTTTINASPEKVWSVLWNDESYRKWTKPFHPTSYVTNDLASSGETDWQKGSKLLFLGEGESGMVAYVEENIPNRFMSIKHVGEVKNGVEDLNTSWGETYENYTLTTKDGKTELLVEAPVPPEYLEMFNKMWPNALKVVKELAEKD